MILGPIDQGSLSRRQERWSKYTVTFFFKFQDNSCCINAVFVQTKADVHTEGQPSVCGLSRGSQPVPVFISGARVDHLSRVYPLLCGQRRLVGSTGGGGTTPGEQETNVKGRAFHRTPGPVAPHGHCHKKGPTKLAPQGHTIRRDARPWAEDQWAQASCEGIIWGPLGKSK